MIRSRSRGPRPCSSRFMDHSCRLIHSLVDHESLIDPSDFLVDAECANALDYLAKCDIQVVCQYLVDKLHDAPGQCLLASDVESQLCIDFPICDRNRASFAEQHRWHWFQDLLRCKIKNYFLVNRPPGMMVVIENEFVKFIDHNRGRGAKRNWSEMA